MFAREILNAWFDICSMKMIHHFIMKMKIFSTPGNKTGNTIGLKGRDQYYVVDVTESMNPETWNRLIQNKDWELNKTEKKKEPGNGSKKYHTMVNLGTSE